MSAEGATLADRPATMEAFMRDRLVLGHGLCCPVRVMWREYITWCDQWGFMTGDARVFVRFISSQSGVMLRVGGHGRLHRYFDGVGFTASSTERD